MASVIILIVTVPARGLPPFLIVSFVDSNRQVIAVNNFF